MLRRISRTLIAGCGAAAAAIVIAPPPATAAPEVVAVAMRDVTVAIGGPGVVAGVTLISAEPLVLDDVVVTYDFSALAGLAEVVPPAGADCSLVDREILTCARDQLRLGATPLPGQFDVVVRAVDGATGGEGPLQMSVSAGGVGLVSSTSSWVRVGDGVDLVAGPSAALSRRPGESFTLPLRVDVVGATAVDEPRVYFTDVYAFRATRKFSNCLYVLDRIRSCAFDGTFTPGASYTAVLPFLVGADTAAPATRDLEATWFTAAEAEDYESSLAGHGYSGGEPGTDGDLPLTGVLALRAVPPQADTVPNNNRSSWSVAVTGRNGTDLAAVGAAPRGPVGAVRSVTVGLRNDGPAALDDHNGAAVAVDVTVPSGTTATSVPGECAPLVNGVADGTRGGTPGAAAYRCRPDLPVYPDFTVGFPFDLRIDRAGRADGAVTVTGLDDLDAANNRAAIVVNGPADPAPPPRATGGLPITGAPAGTLAGLGALLILAGACAVVLARTRAT
ncbi:MAG TPA: LPXTG cell wall anchor domain-containing protein [Asanoa sp.]|nr:LPXTG cell wall anchor domain-containing protein [Asanoa sp.]